MDIKLKILKHISVFILCGLFISGSVCMPAFISPAGVYSYAAEQEDTDASASENADGTVIEGMDDVSLPANEEIRPLSFMKDDDYRDMKQI